MKRFSLLTLLLACATGLFAQDDCPNPYDGNDDGMVNISDLLDLLALFGDFDTDVDGVWDSADDCVDPEACNYTANPTEPCLYIDALDVCGGACEGDEDGDGICDDVDTCVGTLDECGVCNGPGPTEIVIDEIITTYDSIFLPVDEEWFVFAAEVDTVFSYTCAPSFASCGDPVSYQGYDYATVQIGDQCWFAENLRNENYENGDAIPAGLSDSDWQNTTSGAVAVYAEGAGCDHVSPDIDACDPAQSLNEYGRLYNWYAVDDARGLCPSGWHVPTDGEWTVMTDFLGGEFVAGGPMKTTYGWYGGGNGTNSSGFSGLPSGGRDCCGDAPAGYIGGWWSSTLSGSFRWHRQLNAGYESVFRYNDFNQSSGFSVRCVQDGLICEADEDEDGICDDLDDCVGEFDACGVCNGPGAIYDCGCEECPAFECGDPTTYQGYDYATVQIGDQCWFAENCRYLPVEPSETQVGSEIDNQPHCYNYYSSWQLGGYGDSAQIVANDYYEKYGALYNVLGVQQWDLCPSGWHEANDEDWITLEVAIGMPLDTALVIGGRSTLGFTLMADTDWDFPPAMESFVSETGSTGFDALGGSYRRAMEQEGVDGGSGAWAWSQSSVDDGISGDVQYGLIQRTAAWWSPSSDDEGMFRSIGSSGTGINRGNWVNHNYAISVRCVQDGLICEADEDEDGICDDLDDCVGEFDACGVCNGPGAIYDCGCEECPAFECGDPTTYQGYDYATVLIGEQCWFAENLRSENYENGDAIPANLNDSEWSSTTSGAVAVFGEGNSSCNSLSPDGDACDEVWSLNEYGRLYNWHAVDDARGLCPSGWHVPSDGDWMELTDYLGGSAVAGDQMKTTYGWHNGGNGTNSSEFAGLPGAGRTSDGGFWLFRAGSSGRWWTSSPYGDNALYRSLQYSSEGFPNHFNNRQFGFSVRCVQDGLICEADEDEDGICDDLDDCVGEFDACGVCNGPGAIYDCGCEECPAFECGDPTTYQGYDYATVQIGDQCWFAENLRNENYENGDAIPSNLSDSEWGATTSGAVAVYGEGAGCNENSPDIDACDPAQSLNEYGRLYNWYAVDDARGLCPSGWHVPTDEEWMTMEMALGMSDAEANDTGGRGTDQGTQMKATYGWACCSGTNSSGFSGLPGGFRQGSGFSSFAGNYAYWWSSSPNDSNAWYRNIYFTETNVLRDNFFPSFGYSVRCVRDAE